jgi:hypothetical protein
LIDSKKTEIAYEQATPAARGKATSVLLVAYLIAKPFYLFPSGGPQIADAIAGILFLLIFSSRQAITRTTSPILAACILFSFYTLIVNSAWALVMVDPNMLKSPAFYFFNTMIVYVILNLHGRTGDDLLKVVLIGTVASCSIQVVLSFWATAAWAERHSLFFTHPNQLGYWGLLSAIIFFAIAGHMKVRILLQMLGVLVFFYLVALSLSKAAIISYALLLTIHFSRNARQFLLVSIIGLIAAFLVSDLQLIEGIVARLDNIGQQSDDSLHGRGWDRIWLYPQHLLFGAGELGLVRFPEWDMELHSTLGVVLFSYGVIGVFLFGLLLWRLLKLAGLREMLYLVPAFTYGLVHQGLRFTLLWVLFALIAVRSASAASRNAESSQPPAGTRQDGYASVRHGLLPTTNTKE